MELRDQLEEKGVVNDDILRLFREAQKELIARIEAIEKGSTFGQFRRKHLLAIDRIVVRLESKAKDWAEDAIPAISKDAADEVYRKLKSFKEADFRVQFSGVPNEAVKALVEQAWGDFGNTMIGLRRSARSAAIEKRKIQERVFKGFVQGVSSSKTQAEVVRDLKEQGFNVLKAKNGFGRRISLEDYANIVVRSQNMAAYNLGAKAQMMGSGRRFARFPTIRPDIDGDDICNEWERKEFVDLMTDELPPASTHPRCFLPGTRVMGRMVRASKSFYSGKAVTIHCREGYRLSVTANHPVLTPRGFVAAASLNAGDKVICDRRQVEWLRTPVTISKERDVYDGPACVEDVFNAISRKGFLRSVRPSSLDLHGDAQPWNGDIDVVEMDRVLRLDSRHASIGDHLGKRRVVGVDVDSLLPNSQSTLDLLVFADLAALGCFPRGAKLSAHQPRIGFDSLPLQRLSFGRRSFLDSVLAKNTLDDVLTDRVLARELHDRHAGSVFVDELTSVRRHPFTGHVYDVESESGWIVAEGVCTSNCRHVVEPVSFAELKAKRPDLYAIATRFFRETAGDI